MSCPILCDPTVCSLPSSSVHGTSQARILEWVAISYSRGSSLPRDQTHICCIAGRFFTTEPPGKPDLPIKMYKIYGEVTHRKAVLTITVIKGSNSQKFGHIFLARSLGRLLIWRISGLLKMYLHAVNFICLPSLPRLDGWASGSIPFGFNAVFMFQRDIKYQLIRRGLGEKP